MNAAPLILIACLSQTSGPSTNTTVAKTASQNSSFFLEKNEKVETNEDGVLEQLRRQEDEYLAYRQSNPSDERIQELLANTRFLIEKLKNGPETKTNRVGGIPEIDDPNYKTIGATIAAFRTAGWKLSAELLSKSLSSTTTGMAYKPIYGGRTISSPNTFQASRSSALTNSISYEYSLNNNCYQNDLAFAIHRCDYTKKSSYSRVVTITDTYDFNKDDTITNPLVSFGNDVYVRLQNEGYIHPFDVEIEVDCSKALSMNPHKKNDGSYDITITNNTGSAKEIIYNEAKAPEDNVRAWANLSMVGRRQLGDNSSTTITMSGNAGDGVFAFSVLEGNFRFITLTATDGSTELIATLRKKYGPIEILGKHGANWTLRYTNDTNTVIKMEYNSKMCFYNDAANWSNLKDVVTTRIYQQAQKTFVIAENWWADAIAIRFKQSDGYLYFYANNLSLDTTMTIHTRYGN